MMLGKILMALLGAALLAGCSNDDHKGQNSGGRQYDGNMLALGDRTYQNHCAICHGYRGEATPGWQKPGADGKLLPPPLDGNGRTSRLSSIQIKQFISHGSPAGRSHMPAWKGKLSDQEIDAVTIWITSLWPDTVYLDWLTHVEQKKN